VNAAAYVATPLNLLLRNDRAPVEIEGVDVTIRSTSNSAARRSSGRGSTRSG